MAKVSVGQWSIDTARIVMLEHGNSELTVCLEGGHKAVLELEDAELLLEYLEGWTTEVIRWEPDTDEPNGRKMVVTRRPPPPAVHP